MLITTGNDLPGYQITEVLGEVFGLTVRSRNVGSQLGATFKSLVGGELKGMTKMLADGRDHATERLVSEVVGGELKGMTKMLADGRDHATERLVSEAEAKGADAIIAFRFDTSELGSTWTEICAYGTAVRARRQ